MRAVYFDCFAGVSGDMIIGAQVDLGADLESIKRQLSSLGLDNYEITSLRVERSGIGATKVDVEVDETNQPSRTLADIRAIIARSSSTNNVKNQALRVFERIAVAEAHVHRTTPDKVHFHEVGAVDSIIDIVGAMIGFELLGVERFFCSPLRLGSGSVNTEHGKLPIPAPATAELLRNVPVYAGELEGEFVTPTGAAIVATLCGAFGPLPPMKVTRIGYGAGSRNPNGFPNALRLMIGEIEESDEASQTKDCATSVYATSGETIIVIESNIDDMNPQVFGFVMERALAVGALDVFLTPVQMKKDRPATLLTVLSKPETVDSLIEMLLSETTTLGVRYYEVNRRVLERNTETVQTPFGPVRIKVARDGARTLHFQPEYDDCAQVAAAARVSFLEVHAAATAAYRDRIESATKQSEEDAEFKKTQRQGSSRKT